MQNNRPFLRLHSGDPEPNAMVARQVPGNDILEVFSEATGWQIRVRGGSPHALARASVNSLGSGKGALRRRFQLISTQTQDGMLDEFPELSLSSTSEESAWRLLESIDDLKSQLHAAERVIAKQEAELATGIGVVLRGDETEMLCDRLQDSLQRATNLTGSDAAGIYLLDEATSMLKLRACWGLATSALSKPARLLRGSMADLEALLGNAVLLENIAMAPEWNSPEEFAAGLCVPIGSPNMPHGTLWLWSNHVRDFSAADIEAAKSSADRILIDVERSVLTTEALRGREIIKQLEAAGVLQASRLPDGQALHPDFDVDGWTFQAGPLGGNFHTWTLNSHGQICLAIADTAACGAAGAIVAASLQTIVEACWNTRHVPGQVIRKANEIAWGHDDADWRGSLGYAQIDPDSGTVQIASAGNIQSFVIGQRGFRMIATNGPAIATQPDATYKTERIMLEQGETMLMATPDVIGGIARGGFTQDSLLALVHAQAEEPATEIASQIARKLPTIHGDHSPSIDRSLLVIKRKFT